MRLNETQRKQPTSQMGWRIAAIAGVLLVGAGLWAPVQADPVTITGGMVSLGGEGGFRYSISGTDFASHTGPLLFPMAGTGLDVGCIDTAAGCAAGTHVSFTTSTSGTVSFGTGNATAGGRNYEDIDLSGNWSFTSPGATLPIATTTFMTISAPFAFAGTLIGSRNGTELFRAVMRGGGEVSAGVIGGNGRFMLDEQDAVDYRFSPFASGPDPAPVPEPASMLLIGTGLAGLAAARRRRTKAEPQP